MKPMIFISILLLFAVATLVVLPVFLQSTETSGQTAETLSHLAAPELPEDANIGSYVVYGWDYLNYFLSSAQFNWEFFGATGYVGGIMRNLFVVVIAGIFLLVVFSLVTWWRGSN